MTDPFEPALADVPAKVKIPESPSDDIANAIGRLSVATAQLEYVMRMWIKTMLGSDFHGAMITNSQMRFETLTDIAASLVNQRSDDEKLITEFGKLRDESRKLAQKRNDYIHGLFARDNSGAPIIVTVKREAKKGLVSKAIKPDVELIRRLAEAVAKKAEDLEKLRHRVRLKPRQQADPEVSGP